MQKLSRQDLWSLEDYAQKRDAFRRQLIEHKRVRSLQVGPHVRLLFEDRLTMQYQIQEMLRAERIFEAQSIQDELDTYNALIPEAGSLTATMMIEFENVIERQQALARLVGIEDRVWLQVAGFGRVHAVADEDMDRSTDDKTSSVHFLRFELAAPMVSALKNGAVLSAGIEHANYKYSVAEVPAELRASLIADLS
ncbi:MAG TPA: DUF3501 family protein [Candidatus Acidoferrales bacterium]|nr:DUF3501 family protein [Candidatus Acidoferrales bacterium]